MNSPAPSPINNSPPPPRSKGEIPSGVSAFSTGVDVAVCVGEISTVFASVGTGVGGNVFVGAIVGVFDGANGVVIGVADGVGVRAGCAGVVAVAKIGGSVTVAGKSTVGTTTVGIMTVGNSVGSSVGRGGKVGIPPIGVKVGTLCRKAF